MATSSTASQDIADDMRDITQAGAKRMRDIANSGFFGLRDLAEHSLEQAREAFLRFLSTAQKTMAAVDQQALDLRQATLSLAARTVATTRTRVTAWANHLGRQLSTTVTTVADASPSMPTRMWPDANAGTLPPSRHTTVNEPKAGSRCR